MQLQQDHHADGRQMTRLAMRKNVSISPHREKYSGWNPQIKKQPSIAARPSLVFDFIVFTLSAAEKRANFPVYSEIIDDKIVALR